MFLVRVLSPKTFRNINKYSFVKMERILDTELEKTVVEWFIGNTKPLSSSTSSESDDETLRPATTNKNVSKLKNFVEETVCSYDDETFKKHFRLSRSVSYRLIEKFKASAKVPNSSNKMGTSAEKCI